MSKPLMSDGNSSTTPLGSAATYTGTWEQTDRPDVMVSLETDNSGTLYFDFSNDGGSNFTTFPSNGFTVSSGIHEFHTAVKGPRSFRIRLVNDSGAQSYLRLYVYYGAFPKSPNSPLNQSLGADADSTVIRFRDPGVDEVLGRLGGVSYRRKFGYATGLGTAIQLGTPSSWVDIWAYGGLRTPPTTSFTPYTASASGSDTGNVTWQYLDGNGDRQTVEVTLTGQTPVSLGVTATDVLSGWNSGTADFVGQVTCTTANNFTSGVPDNQAEVLAAIPVNDNRTQVLAERVPTGKQFLFDELDLGLTRASGAAGSATLAFAIKEPGGVFQNRRPIEIQDGSARINLKGIKAPAGSIIQLRARDVSDPSTSITATLRYREVDA